MKTPKEKGLNEAFVCFCKDRYGRNWKSIISLCVAKEAFRFYGRLKYINKAINIALKEQAKQILEKPFLRGNQDMEYAERWFNKLSVGGQLEAIYDAFIIKELKKKHLK